MEALLVDQETGEEVSLGEAGEIVLRGPQVMMGYWPEVGSGLTQEGWLHTGDIGHLDEQQYLFITGRKKELIVTSGGKNIAPARIEGILATSKIESSKHYKTIYNC